MNVADIMVRDVRYVTNHTLVSKALSLMKREHVKELPVVSGGKVKGLITMHSIVTYPRNPNSLTVSRLMFKTPLLSEDDDVFTALSFMKEAGVEGLPVARGEELVGFVSDYDLIKALRSEFKGLLINNFVRPVPALLKMNDNVSTAKRLFHYNKVKALPVVDKDNKLTGVIVEDDLLDLLKPSERMGYGVEGEGNSRKLLSMTIKSILRRDYESAMIGDNVIKVIDIMLERHLTSVIVIDDENEPVGYVGRFELIDYLYNKRKPRGVLLEFTGMDLDYMTNAVLTKVVQDHLNRVNYLARNIKGIKVQIKGLHEGEGARKFELVLKLTLSSGVVRRVKNVGYALRECLDEALTNLERMMKKDYKKSNP